MYYVYGDSHFLDGMQRLYPSFFGSDIRVKSESNQDQKVRIRDIVNFATKSIPLKYEDEKMCIFPTAPNVAIKQHI